MFSSRGTDMSAWYYLSYVVGGDRLQVYEDNTPTTQGPESAIAKSQNIAWHVATTLLGQTRGVARPGEIPDWARPRTHNVDGSSAGLLYALADLDILTPGRLAGELRVAATGSILGDGVIAGIRPGRRQTRRRPTSPTPTSSSPPTSLPTPIAATTVVYHQGHHEPSTAPSATGSTPLATNTPGASPPPTPTPWPSSPSTTSAKRSPGSADAHNDPPPAPSPKPSPPPPPSPSPAPTTPHA